MIEKRPFGSTGHDSTVTIFGGVALADLSRKEAGEVLETLLDYGINHIDVAPDYGDAELRIGPWMDSHRDQFFLSTKIHERSYEEARRQIENSLSRLHVDRIDLLQMHSLTKKEHWERAFSAGGALEAMVEAKEEGLVDNLGVTGHTLKAPEAHLRSLGEYDFDAVLLPYNYPLMQNPDYSAHFNQLLETCKQRGVAVQTIKSAARRLWHDNEERDRPTWYKPLEQKEEIEKATHWVMGNKDVFLVTTGDPEITPLILEAADNFEPGARPTEEEMDELVKAAGMEPLWPGGIAGGQ